MINVELETISDLLLATAEFDRDSPCYTEDYFRRKTRKSNKRATNSNPEARDLHASCLALYESEIEDMIRLAGLTAKQMDIYLTRKSGESYKAIGLTYGVTKQAACKTFKAVREKLNRASRRNPYAGLSEIYRQEVRRTTKSKT